MFAHDRGWRRRLDEALLTGLTAEAAVERVRNDTRARMLRQTDPYLRERLHDIDDLSNRLLRLLAGGARRRRRRAICRKTRSSSPAPWVRPSCSITTASACAGWCSRKAARRAMSPSSRARSGLAAISQAKGVLEAVEAGDAVDRRRRRRRAACAADAGGGGGLCRQGPLSRQAPGPICGLAQRAGGHARRGAGVAATSMPGSCSICRISTSPAPTASACSAPSCNS